MSRPLKLAPLQTSLRHVRRSAHNADFCRLRISKNPANAHETKDFSALMLEETMVMQVVREIRLIMIVQDYVIKKKIVSNYDDHV